MGLMGTIGCCWMMEHSWKDDNDDDDDDVRAFVRIKSVSERSLSWSFFFFSIDDGTSIMWFVSIGIKLLVIDNAILGFCKNLSEQFCWKYSWQSDDVHACALV